AWPGMGYVASKTVSYLVETLGADRFAFINPDNYFSPASVIVEESVARIPPLPSSNFYFWKNRVSGSDLILFLGESQPSTHLQIRMAREVLGLAVKMGVFRLWTFAAAPAPIQHKDVPRIWGVASSGELREYLAGHEVSLLEMGHISGLNGLLLGAASQVRIPGICLLGEIPYYTVNLENPRAAGVILHLLQDLFSLRIDFRPLEDDIEKFDQEIASIGKKAQETMATFIHPDDEVMDFSGMIDEEEEEEPGEEESRPLSDSARRRIEELFRLVRRDPLQAPRLKEELDKWGVYPLFEDRFLDLFRGGEDRRDN
ncbi:MAG: PAC2 family protein, partial [PVC group bacterium]